jgi:hypothetical protein
VARKPTEDPELDDDFNDPAPATADDRATEGTVNDDEQRQPETKSVGKSVGKTRPTSVGRKNPTHSPTSAKSIFGTDRKANIKGRKLHPSQCSDQKNLTLREHLIGALAILADREGMASQPGKVADYLLEFAFTELAPDVLAEAYQDVCDDLGVKNDRL